MTTPEQYRQQRADEHAAKHKAGVSRLRDILADPPAADALAGDPTPATRPLQAAPPPASYLNARRDLSKQPPEQGA